MKNNKGFSLVELIVVIAIMAILAAVAVVSYSVYIDRANDAVDQDYISNVLYRVKLFALEYGIGVEEVVIAPEVNGPEDIKLIIGRKENGDPIYYEDVYKDGKQNEIYETVGDHVMSGDHANYNPNNPITPILPPSGGNPGGDAGDGDHTHSYTETARVESTCTTAGSVTYSCGGCDSSYTEQLPLGNHNLVKKDSYEGFELHECTVCGHLVIKNSGGNAVAPIQ